MAFNNLKATATSTAKGLTRSPWLYLFLVVVSIGFVVRIAQTRAIDVSNGYEGKAVNLTGEISWFNRAKRDYKEKTGYPLNSNGVTYTWTYEDTDSDMDAKGYKQHAEIHKEVTLDTFMKRPLILKNQGYRLRGTIVKRYQLTRGSVDIMRIRTDKGPVKIYYQGGLPNAIQGQEVEITGTVLGSEVHDHERVPVMVSSRAATKIISD